MDLEISKEFQKILNKQGINFKLESKVKSIKNRSNSATVEYIDNKTSKTTTIEADTFSLSWKKTLYGGFKLIKVGIYKDDKGRIKVNKKFQTSVENIYAIGDVIKGNVSSQSRG